MGNYDNAMRRRKVFAGTQAVSVGDVICHEGNGTPCKHLKGDKPGEYSCALHDMKWYKKTPCFSHGQIERGNTNCRMGEYVLGISKLVKKKL
jgi:hypothetical protein